MDGDEGVDGNEGLPTPLAHTLSCPPPGPHPRMPLPWPPEACVGMMNEALKELEDEGLAVPYAKQRSPTTQPDDAASDSVFEEQCMYLATLGRYKEAANDQAGEGVKGGGKRGQGQPSFEVLGLLDSLRQRRQLERAPSRAQSVSITGSLEPGCLECAEWERKFEVLQYEVIFLSPCAISLPLP